MVRDNLVKEASWSLDEHDLAGHSNQAQGLSTPAQLQVEPSKITAVPRRSASALGASLPTSAACSLEGNANFETVLGSQCRLKGEFVFNEGCEIRGFVEGKIISDAELIFAISSEIRAEISGRVVIVGGRVIGDIICTELLELRPGARVSGNIASPRLIIHDGVQFDGSCKMGEVSSS